MHRISALNLPARSKWKPYLDENPFFVTIEPDKRNHLREKSVVDCFQIRPISHARFAGKIGEISIKTYSLMKRAVALILDIDPEDCE